MAALMERVFRINNKYWKDVTNHTTSSPIYTLGQAYEISYGGYAATDNSGETPRPRPPTQDDE